MKYSRARDFKEMNAALDEFTIPAQNVLMVDRAGNVGYRTSGTGVQRKITGRRPQRAIDGEWAGLEPASMRPLATATIPPTGLHLANSHGVFTSAASARATATASVSPDDCLPRSPPLQQAPPRRPRIDWATLLQHTCGCDVLRCHVVAGLCGTKRA